MIIRGNLWSIKIAIRLDDLSYRYQVLIAKNTCLLFKEISFNK